MKAYKIERPSRESLAGRREDPKSHRQVHPVVSHNLGQITDNRNKIIWLCQI